MTSWWLLLALLPLLPLLGWVGLRATWTAFAHQRYVEYVRHKQLDAPIPTVADHLRDGWANTLLSLWRVLPAGSAIEVPHPRTGRPVLCIHGFVGRGSDFRALRAALHAHGRPTAAPDLGWRFQGVASYAPPVEGTLEALIQAFGEVDVVAHSMGGLVLRAVLERRPDLAAHVHTAITLGSPHAGTASVRGTPPGRPPDFDDLKRGAEFHRTVPSLPELLPGSRVVTVAGAVDLVVYPTSTCHAEGAERVDVHLGHTELLTSRQATDLVLELLS